MLLMLINVNSLLKQSTINQKIITDNIRFCTPEFLIHNHILFRIAILNHYTMGENPLKCQGEQHY